MQLPSDSIGISDILEWRRCAASMAHGMRRHTEMAPELQLEAGELDDPTEATNENNAYGSCVHEAFSIVDREGVSDEQAVRRAFPRYAPWLDPGDIALLVEDLKMWHRRRLLGVTLVAAEKDLRVPLFIHEGRQIYFRFKIDALYRLISNPDVFIMRDYKSSKWRKSPAEVHADPQQWAYNFGVHEYLPECRQLIQIYDQLRFGEVRTSKNDEQRKQMKAWLIANVEAIMADEKLKPTANEFCRFCPLVVTCRETKRLTKEWRGRLSLLAPLTKQGRRVKVELATDAFDMEEMIERDLPQIMQTRKHLEHVEKELKRLLGQMPQEQREALGWLLKDRRTRAVAPEGLRELHAHMGDSFYELVNLPITRLEELVGKPKKGQPLPPELEIARNWTTEEVSGMTLIAANSSD